MNRSKTLFSVIIIVILSGGVTTFIFSTEPEAQIEGATKQSAMLVEYTRGERGDFRPTIKASGTVEASRDINLSSQVAGQVVKISESFVPGASVKDGEVLIQIDPADYKNIIELRTSDLLVAEAQLEIEMGQQEAARNDYRMANQAELVQNKSLILREPQLKTAKANVKAAQSSLAQARLNLQRTTIRAPFNANIITRSVNKGSQVNVGDVLGRLVGNEEYWVRLNVPVSVINKLNFTEADQEGITVTMRNASWPEGMRRKGRLYQLVGSVTDQTRFAQVLVQVDEPMNPDGDTPPLIMGTFVEASIPASKLNNVIRLDREFLRRNNTVWVNDDNKLNVRSVKVAFEDQQYVYVQEGLSETDQIITTNISTVVEGAALRSSGDMK